MIIHSLGGRLTMTMSPSEIILNQRRGSGIPDIEQALREGYSTGEGKRATWASAPGLGLPT